MKEMNADSKMNRDYIQPLVYFADILKGIKKFWWISVSLAVIFGGVVFYNSYICFVPVYDSSATFTVETQYEDSTLTGATTFSFYYNKSSAEQLSKTFPYILQTNLLQEAIRQDLNLKGLSETLSASYVKNSNLITLTATGSDAQEVYDVLCSAIKNYPNVAKYSIGNIKLNMITEPQVAEKPSNSMEFLSKTLMGMLAGCLAGLLWVFVYAFFRETIRTEENIKSILNQEVIGLVPKVILKKYNQEFNHSVLINNPIVYDGFEDSVCVVRNTLLHSLQEGEKVVMITSTAPGEGKTTVAANLALSLASIGKNVLLVDGDIRNPNIEAIFHIEKDSKKASDEIKTVTRYDDLNISILTFNISQRKLWKVIRIDNFKEMIDSLRDKYDYILIDTPPCGLISDASVIARASDKIVYVIQQDMVRTSRIKRGMGDLISGGTKLAGCILNGASVGSVGYGYGYGRYGYGYGYGRYGYGYGRYGYGYGYGYGEERKKKSDE